jgi:hypothetical protein
MRPALKAGLLPLWRDRDTLQLGVDPRRAVALTGLGKAAAVISLLDGSRDREAVIAAAQSYGIPAGAADRVLALLAAAGVLDDFPISSARGSPRNWPRRRWPTRTATPGRGPWPAGKPRSSGSTGQAGSAPAWPASSRHPASATSRAPTRSRPGPLISRPPG